MATMETMSDAELIILEAALTLAQPNFFLGFIIRIVQAYSAVPPTPLVKIFQLTPPLRVKRYG